MRKVIRILLVLLSILFSLPVILTFVSSLMTNTEIFLRFTNVPHEWGQPEGLTFIPNLISIKQFYNVLIETSDYLQMFWNSAFYAAFITIGVNIVAIPLAFLFSKVKFKGRNAVFFMFIILMLLPFQVTVLSNYIFISRIGLMGTIWAVLLPSIFMPVGVFLLRQSMISVPDELIDATVLETNSILKLLFYTILPCSKSGLIALNILVFAESWNMIELPEIFLKNQQDQPLALALNGMINNNIEVAFAGSVLFILPIIFLYVLFEEQIVNGLENFKW